jgi:cytochrome subunit of sulfide dehydrogenase
MKRTNAKYLLGLLALCAGAAHAAEDHNGRNWAAACSACHGTNGHAMAGMVALAGMDKTHMVNTLQDFKSGKRPATLMHQIAKGYSDEQIGQIAEYFSKQK